MITEQLGTSLGAIGGTLASTGHNMHEELATNTKSKIPFTQMILHG